MDTSSSTFGAPLFGRHSSARGVCFAAFQGAPELVWAAQGGQASEIMFSHWKFYMRSIKGVAQERPKVSSEGCPGFRFQMGPTC